MGMFEFFGLRKPSTKTTEALGTGHDVNRPHGDADVAEWTGQESPIPPGEEPVEFVSPIRPANGEVTPQGQEPPQAGPRG